MRCCIGGAVAAVLACCSIAVSAGENAIISAMPWTIKDYNDKLLFETNAVEGVEPYIVIRGTTNKCDTAWSAVTRNMKIPEGACEFLLSFEVKSPKLVVDQGKSGEGWNSAIAWYGADGKKLSSQPILRHVVQGDSRFHDVREWGEIPAGAASCSVRLGFDNPNILLGDEVCYRGFRMEFLDKAHSRRAEFEARQNEKQWLRDALYPPAGYRQVVTLRDDGITLIDGKPFFPIGIYSVCKREFNGMSFDRAFSGLKEAGFNFAHTYGNSYAPDFLEAAKKYGFKLWVSARMPDRNFLDVGRWNPSIIAWYLGDDTSGHQTPQELSDNNAAVKAVDPTRLTCQADPIASDRFVSNYAGYVRGTDVFMPEIYPVRNDETDKTCVAETIRDMQRVASDVRMFGETNRTYACWPIIQYFKGWGGWKHFPTKEQLFAMSWASIIHGAHGITWYTYGGFTDVKKGKYNEGITSTPERWKTISGLATKIKDLSPVLLERTPKDQPRVEIKSGPAKDPLGENPSVTALLKRHGGKDYLFAVNASPEPVVADILLPNGEVVRHEFGPFGVMVP